MSDTTACEACGTNHRSWPRPIPVGERLPEEAQSVLCYDGTWWVGRRWKGHWEEPGSVGLQFVSVTHWLPIPPNQE